jgi:hypothetical protein
MTQHFQQDDQVGMQEWAVYALRPNGPAWHTTPTPLDCTVARGAPGYIVSGLLLGAGSFIIKLGQFSRWRAVFARRNLSSTL